MVQLCPTSILFVVVSIIIWTTVNFYLYKDDFQWNPLKSYNFKYSQISFKSLSVSAQVNLIIFIAKPFCNHVIRYVKRKWQKCKRCKKVSIASPDTTANLLVGTEYQRCSSVYKRPHVKWDQTLTNINTSARTALNLYFSYHCFKNLELKYGV